ncbi:unnamed protein product [Callosobruchus maculatus]|uniref:Uncharacterized protein n=1 Tax=Callosobruchus maculatus TaxID=64391 RepID=A0A653D023_CALMS|nr:unnamed protein product [Callosobruchus maculatus]
MNKLINLMDSGTTTNKSEGGFGTESGAYVDLKSVSVNMPNKPSSPSLRSDAIFEFIIDEVKKNPQKAKSIGGVFLYKITKDKKEAKQWSI